MLAEEAFLTVVILPETFDIEDGTATLDTVITQRKVRSTSTVHGVVAVHSILDFHNDMLGY